MILGPLLTPSDFSAGTGGEIQPDDPRVLPLLEAVSSAIRRYCGWHVTPVIEETVVLDGPGGRVLTLPSLKVVDVTAVSVRGVALDIADVEWSENGEIRGCWPDRYRSVSVTYTHGYEDAADLAQIVQQVAANAITSPLGATREQFGIVSVEWATTAPGVSGGLSLLERDLAVLDSYRLPRSA